LDILGWKIEEETSGDGAATETAVYLTDTSEIPAASRKIIGKPAILIIGALRIRPHTTHFSFEQALNAALETGAKRVWLTHICHDCPHEEIIEYCRNFIEERGLKGISAEPSYDGLEIAL
jgi:phosphoribosyl 1,2-cyclic phosphate phosphodiesterase